MDGMPVASPSSTAVPRVVVVEPDVDIRAAVSELLVEQGFQVASVAKMTQAFDVLGAHDASLVLTDFERIPNEESWETLSRVKTAAAPAAVGLLTAWNVTEEQVAEAQVDFLLRKPFGIEAFLFQVGQHTARAPAKAEEVDLMRRYFDALTQKDWSGLGKLCTDDVEYDLPTGNERFASTVKGREEFCRHAEETFSQFPNVVFELDATVPLPSSAVVGRYNGSWVGPSGQKDSLPGAVLFRFENHRISHVGVRIKLGALMAKLPPAAG